MQPAKGSLMVTILSYIVIGLLAVIGLGLAMLYLNQDKLIFYPSKEIVANPGYVGLDYEIRPFTTEDGLQLNGWWIPAANARGAILYLHGNAGNRSGRLGTVELLNGLGYHVYLIDYRGYGENKGKPSEKGLQKDVTAAWQKMLAMEDVEETSSAIMGRSLGGAMAAWLASQPGVNPAAVVMESTFTSLPELASEIYRIDLLKKLVKYRFNTLEYVGEISAPVFMAHSFDDELVPFVHAEKLREAVPNLKQFVRLNGDHGNAWWMTGDKYREALDAFLNNYAAQPNAKIEEGTS